MHSLLALILLLFVSLVVQWLAVGIAARFAHAPVSVFRRAVTAVLGASAFGIVGGCLAALIPTGDEWLVIPLLLTQAGVTILLFRQVFRLTYVRAISPLAALIVAGGGMSALTFFVLVPSAVETFKANPNPAPPLVEGDRITLNKLLTPQRWDLMGYSDGIPGGLLFHRVVGLPGERVRIVSGSVVINGQPIPSPLGITYEPLPDNVENARFRGDEEAQLGADEYFVLGDAPERSMDSRVLGPIQRSRIVGIADLRFWPLSRFHVFR